MIYPLVMTHITMENGLSARTSVIFFHQKIARKIMDVHQLRPDFGGFFSEIRRIFGEKMVVVGSLG